MKLYIAQNPETEDYEKKWQFCVGSCHASTLLRKDAVELLKRVHDELGIQRVRCHGIFNDDMGVATRFSQIFQAPMGENILEYNFYKVGLAYDNLLSAGMRPFVELSFMPEALAANPTRNFVYGSIPSMPKDLAKWREFMRAFLDYLFHRYGEEEVMQWYFEVWNEPDLPDVFNSGTLNDYFPFYEATARTIREYCPGLKVGGPASSCSSHIDVFVDFCEKNNVPLDFVSTHQYIGEPFIGVEKQVVPLSPEEMKAQQKAMQELRVRQKRQLADMPEDTPLLQCFRQVFGGFDNTQRDDYDVDILAKNAAVVRKQAKGLPVFYTEWNMSASFGAYSHDCRKMAAYDVRTSLSIENLVDGDSIWCYSDIFEELHQFKEPFHGGYGMMNYSGIPKPVYHGMRMLAQAENKRILLDREQFTEIEAAAFEGEREKQILLFRLNMMQSDAAKEKAEVTVELPAPPERVYLQRIDEEHCNPLRVWEEMGQPNDLTKAEVEYITEASAMGEEELAFSYADGRLVTEVSLGINDLYFIRIVKSSVKERETIC